MKNNSCSSSQWIAQAGKNTKATTRHKAQLRIKLGGKGLIVTFLFYFALTNYGTVFKRTVRAAYPTEHPALYQESALGFPGTGIHENTTAYSADRCFRAKYYAG